MDKKSEQLIDIDDQTQCGNNTKPAQLL